MSNKDTGSFYTPQELVEYMVSFVRNRCSPTRILEPSAGDGRFVKPLQALNSSITLIENDPEKAKILSSTFKKEATTHCTDFIKFSCETDDKYDLIIGNPPYIAKKNLSEEQIESVETLLRSFNFSDNSIFQNLWVAFVLGSVKILSNNGAVFFVLPFEFLQVIYAEKVRNYLESIFNTIEIVTFEQQVFEEIEQDICLVFLANEREGKPYIKYTTLQSITDQKPKHQSVIMRNKPLQKWSNSIIDDEETESLKRIANKYSKVSSFGNCAPGIVTGANGFFIISRKYYAELNLPAENQLPIISKSSMIPPLLLLGEQDFSQIEIDEKKRTRLLNLNGLNFSSFTPALKDYLEKGKVEKINERYKCKDRKRWYDVPVIKNGTVWFFKRYHLIPRAIVNSSNLYSTDIAYNIRLNDAFDAASFCFSFYNSLTLALCEYSGRFYGGGVCELVPSEFKNLHVPYRQVSQEKILELDNMFRNKTEIMRIVDFVDKEVLVDLSAEELALLKSIRNRYLFRRIKKQEGDK